MMIGASELEALLRDERVAAQSFREQIMQQDNESQQHSAAIERLSRKEKALEEKCREQVRISLSRSGSGHLQSLVGTGAAAHQELH